MDGVVREDACDDCERVACEWLELLRANGGKQDVLIIVNLNSVVC